MVSSCHYLPGASTVKIFMKEVRLTDRWSTQTYHRNSKMEAYLKVDDMDQCFLLASNILDG